MKTWFVLTKDGEAWHSQSVLPVMDETAENLVECFSHEMEMQDLGVGEFYLVDKKKFEQVLSALRPFAKEGLQIRTTEKRPRPSVKIFDARDVIKALRAMEAIENVQFYADVAESVQEKKAETSGEPRRKG